MQPHKQYSVHNLLRTDILLWLSLACIHVSPLLSSMALIGYLMQLLFWGSSHTISYTEKILWGSFSVAALWSMVNIFLSMNVVAGKQMNVFGDVFADLDSINSAWNMGMIKLSLKLPLLILPLCFICGKRLKTIFWSAWPLVVLPLIWISVASVIHYFMDMGFYNQMVLESKPIPLFTRVYHIEYSVIVGLVIVCYSWKLLFGNLENANNSGQFLAEEVLGEAGQINHIEPSKDTTGHTQQERKKGPGSGIQEEQGELGSGRHKINCFPFNCLEPQGEDHRSSHASQKAILGIALFVLVVSMHILGSRTGLVLLYGGFSCMALAWMFQKPKQGVKYISLFIGLIGLMAFLPSVQNRISNTLVDMRTLVAGKEVSNQSFGQRWMAWKSAIHLIQSDPGILFRGKGVLLDEKLHSSYEELRINLAASHRIGVHNQFLETILQSGLISLLAFFMGWIFWIGSRRKKVFLLALSMAIGLGFAMFFESLLERQAGVLACIIAWQLVEGVEMPLKSKIKNEVALNNK
ncbi:MAG: hypothetical protein CK532_05955 [Flavobacteriales bacterium]|nr:MAG: hypothetical protein CK543_02830 [Flavobacteriales bacterium]PHX91879.1 MAG: hypothetical protein CK532_05955 [Flavobacteriales bacterium]